MGAAPLTVKIGLGLSVVGLIIFMIGFCTDSWASHEFQQLRIDPRTKQIITVSGKINFGLWKQCHSIKQGGQEAEQCRYFLDLDSDDVKSAYRSLAGELRAAQFFETVALITLIPAFLFIILGACVESCQNRKIMPILGGVCLLAAAGCVFLGAIIFSSWEGVGENLSWSFALAIVGGVFFTFAGIAVIVGAIMNK